MTHFLDNLIFTTVLAGAVDLEGQDCEDGPWLVLTVRILALDFVNAVWIKHGRGLQWLHLSCSGLGLCPGLDSVRIFSKSNGHFFITFVLQWTWALSSFSLRANLLQITWTFLHPVLLAQGLDGRVVLSIGTGGTFFFFVGLCGASQNEPGLVVKPPYTHRVAVFCSRGVWYLSGVGGVFFLGGFPVERCMRMFWHTCLFS